MEHDWVDVGTGLVTCANCPVKATPLVIEQCAVPPCSTDERCPVPSSAGRHEITTDMGGGGSCLFCLEHWNGR
jgi:hypothetical protein